MVLEKIQKANDIKNLEPEELEVANKYGAAVRVDNYTIPGLRIGLSRTSIFLWFLQVF